MKKTFNLVLFIWIAILLVCCTHQNKNTISYSQYSEEAAMAHYLTDPDRSLTLLDSAVQLKNITPQRADYLKAIIYYSSKDETAHSLELCQKLIDEKSWNALPDSEDVTSFQVDVYRLMATIHTSTGNYPAVLRYAREGAKLAHGIDNLKGDEADFMSRMGYVMARMGQADEGLQTMRRAEELAYTNKDWSSLITYLNNAKKIYHTLSEQKQYAEAKKEVFHIKTQLEDYPHWIDKVKFIPEGIRNDSAALLDFIQYHQVIFYSYLTNLYTKEVNKDSTLYWLNKTKAIPQSDNISIVHELVEPLIYLEKYEEAGNLLTAQTDEIGDKKLSEDYIQILMSKRKIALLQGNNLLANQLTDEIFQLSDNLKTNQIKEMLADAAAQYQVQDEKLRRVDAEDKLQWMLIIFIILCVLTISIFSYLYIQKLLTKLKELRYKYAKAKKALKEFNHEVEEVETKPQDLSQEDIFNRALTLMEENQLYKDPNFDIQMLAARIPTNRSYLSSAINSMSGMNFRSWLAKFRVEHAKQVLKENPSITNENLAEQCGYDNRVSLYRQFKNLEGMTPNEWISQYVEHHTL